MLGDKDGHVSLIMEKPVLGFPETSLVCSDNFGGDKLKLNWEWNHNPVDEAWSLTERSGYLRLKTSRVVSKLYAARNTITQRMEGPKCSGGISMDISHMKAGYVAGFGAFNGHSGLLSVKMDGSKKYLIMSTNVVDLDNSAGKVIRGVDVEEKACINLSREKIYLRIDCYFSQHRDMAIFYYSLDNKKWTKFGTNFKMRFDYTKLFMGTRFAIFNYATKVVGGYVDVDFFHYKREK